MHSKCSECKHSKIRFGNLIFCQHRCLRWTINIGYVGPAKNNPVSPEWCPLPSESRHGDCYGVEKPSGESGPVFETKSSRERGGTNVR